MTETAAPVGAAPTATSGPATPGGRLSHRQIVVILSGLMLGMFLAALDQTVVSTAIRTIADDLNGYDLQAWATTAFLITSTIATPLYGKLSDIYGRRGFYLFAIGVFVLGSALCGLSQSMYELATFSRQLHRFVRDLTDHLPALGAAAGSAATCTEKDR